MKLFFAVTLLTVLTMLPAARAGKAIEWDDAAKVFIAVGDRSTSELAADADLYPVAGVMHLVAARYIRRSDMRPMTAAQQAVINLPKKYRKWNAGTLLWEEKSVAEKTAADLVEWQAVQAAKSAELVDAEDDLWIALAKIHAYTTNTYSTNLLTLAEVGKYAGATKYNIMKAGAELRIRKVMRTLRRANPTDEKLELGWATLVTLGQIITAEGGTIEGAVNHKETP